MNRSENISLQLCVAISEHPRFICRAQRTVRSELAARGVAQQRRAFRQGAWRRRRWRQCGVCPWLTTSDSERLQHITVQCACHVSNLISNNSYFAYLKASGKSKCHNMTSYDITIALILLDEADLDPQDLYVTNFSCFCCLVDQENGLSLGLSRPSPHSTICHRQMQNKNMPYLYLIFIEEGTNVLRFFFLLSVLIFRSLQYGADVHGLQDDPLTYMTYTRYRYTYNNAL